MASRPKYRHQSRSPPALSSKPLNSPPSSSSSTAGSSSKQALEASTDGGRSHEEGSKEHVTVTVRFRPLSPRETRQGEGIAWYADGDAAVRSEHDPSVAYAYDRVFGPTTTTHHVYDVAAQHVVTGAMKGINGTIFAYGVTSSGKTHTMHGDQRSPGIIPLAVKDAFSIIQETPSREFLLRVSYLEIYNEVVNDLLNPAGQNLRIREDLQGTFVEGIKEEVVHSPVHALSLIAAGEEHRHVGSNNLNLLSSRSHTIFSLTIESSPCGGCCENEAVNLSQLNLIDLAGSESSRAETTGVRQKEGSYINKSLLTLRTVIAKLSDGKGIHIPYRDCKLTRLLQSSLSGQGHVSLICTVTPSSCNSEETHNTLKFAHRAKQIEIQASQNKITDEKSLIKKYQNEIQSLKEELEQLERGMVNAGAAKDIRGDDLVLLKRELEDGHVKLQSRLEQEEEAKAVLLERIQCLTKLILVSTKATQSPRFSQHPGPRRRYSFREEELAYLPYKRRDMDMVLDDESCDILVPVEGYDETIDRSSRDKNRKHGLLNWLKIWRRESGASTLTSSDDKSSGRESLATPSTPQAESVGFPADSRISISLAESIPAGSLLTEHDRELPTDTLYLQQTPKASMKTINHVDLLREQLKILSGEVAPHSSCLKRHSDETANNPKKEQSQIDMRKVGDEIRMKNQQIASLEKQMADSISTSHSATDKSGLSLSYDELLEQLNGMSFELEVKAADNRIIQDQLQQKICEREELRDAVASLKQQLALALDTNSSCLSAKPQYMNKENLLSREITSELLQQAHMVSEIEGLKQRVEQLSESKSQLEGRNRKLAEEGAYAKGLASAAGVELKALSEEVTKLMKDNERLASELASARNAPKVTRRDGEIRRKEPALAQRETKPRYHERVVVLEAALREKEQREAELRKKVQLSKQKEAFLENELANVQVLVEKLKKSNGNDELDSSDSSNEIYRRI